MGIDLIVGAGVSLIVELIKKYFGTKEYISLALVLIISIVAASIYAFLVQAMLWDKILPVLISAGAIYAYIIKRFESKQ